MKQTLSPRGPPLPSLTKTRSSTHNQIAHASSDVERSLTHVHNSSSRSQDISTDQEGQTSRGNHAEHNLYLFDQHWRWELSLGWKRPLCHHHQNLHLSASRVSSTSSRRTPSTKFVHQSELATQKRQAVSMISNPRSDLNSTPFALCIIQPRTQEEQCHEARVPCPRYNQISEIQLKNTGGTVAVAAGACLWRAVAAALCGHRQEIVAN